MFADYKEIVAAFGASYLKGKVEQVLLDNKFCMLDNLGSDSLDDCQQGMPAVPEVAVGRKIRYPVNITMSFCICCRKGELFARIQQKDYCLREGDVMLIFAGLILEKATLSQDCQVIFIAIDSEFILTQIRNKYGNQLKDWIMRSKEPTKMHLDNASFDNFVSLCNSIKFIIGDSGADFMDGIIYGFTTIFGNLLTSWYRSDSSVSRDAAAVSNAENVFMRFQSDIHNFSRRYKSVEYYARRQGLSVRQFSRLVKESGGRKPSEVISEYVILEAKSLLQTRRYTVHQVAEKLGFDNDSFFSRYFKARTGLTPGEYRNRS